MWYYYMLEAGLFYYIASYVKVRIWMEVSLEWVKIYLGFRFKT